jgi:MFS family permease
LWTRFFVLLLVINLVVYNAHYMLLTSLPTFIAGIGGTSGAAGVLAGVFTFAALGFRPLAGKFLDERGRRVVLIAAAAVLTACSMLYPFLSAFALLLILRVIHGAGYGAFTTATGTVLADLAPDVRLTEAIGYLGIAGTFSTAAGPVLGLYFLGVNAHLLFGALAGSGLLIAGMSMLLTYERQAGAARLGSSQIVPISELPALLPATASRERTEAAAGGRRGRLFEPSARWVALVSFFGSFPLDAIMMYIATYGKDRNFVHISMFFPVHAVGMILTYLFLGRIVDRIGPKRVFLPSISLVLLTYVMLAAARNEITVAAAAFIFGIGIGLQSAVLRDFVIRLSPKASLGAANATFMTASDLGFGIGSVVLGFVLQGAGFTVFFLVSFVAAAVSGGVYLACLCRQLTQHEAKQAAIALSGEEA